MKIVTLAPYNVYKIKQFKTAPSFRTLKSLLEFYMCIYNYASTPFDLDLYSVFSMTFICISTTEK